MNFEVPQPRLYAPAYEGQNLTSLNPERVDPDLTSEDGGAQLPGRADQHEITNQEDNLFDGADITRQSAGSSQGTRSEVPTETLRVPTPSNEADYDDLTDSEDNDSEGMPDINDYLPNQNRPRDRIESNRAETARNESRQAEAQQARNLLGVQQIHFQIMASAMARYRQPQQSFHAGPEPQVQVQAGQVHEHSQAFEGRGVDALGYPMMNVEAGDEEEREENA